MGRISFGLQYITGTKSSSICATANILFRILPSDSERTFHFLMHLFIHRPLSVLGTPTNYKGFTKALKDTMDQLLVVIGLAEIRGSKSTFCFFRQLAAYPLVFLALNILGTSISGN